MRHSQADVVVTATVAILSAAAALVGAPTPVTAVLGIALLAAPGYVWVTILLGSRVAGLERVAVAAGLSLAIPVLGGLALFAAGSGLTRVAWTGLIAEVTLAGDVVLFARRRTGRLAPFAWPPRRRRPPIRHVAAFGAAVVVAVSAVALARVGVALEPRTGFTQLWLTARAGHEHVADVGVRNHQGSTTRYRLVLSRHGGADITWSLTLANGQSWHHAVPDTGANAMTADLYRLPDLGRPYRHVDIGVGAPGP